MSAGIRGGMRALVLALVILGGGASGASAVVVDLPNGTALSYQPLRGALATRIAAPVLPQVEYGSGSVMVSNTNYAFYWDPPGAPAYPGDYQTGVNRYFRDIAHDSGGQQNVDSVSSQYDEASGEFAEYDSHFGGALIDRNPYPPNGCKQAAICLTDKQIRAELASYIGAHGLPADLAHEYFFLPPPGVENCAEAAGAECSPGTPHPEYCAYHSAFHLGEGGTVIYSNDPFVTGNPGCDDGNHPNGTSADGVIEGGLTHEHNESITDPPPGSAWEETLTGEEVGDKCNSNMGTPLGIAPNGVSYNQVVNGHLYWYEQVWSNKGHRCRQRLASRAPEATASFTTAPGTGRTVHFDARGSSAPGGVVEYAWEFNFAPYSLHRELSQETTVRTTTPTASFTFKKAGVFPVALTVFSPNGTSIGTARGVVAH